MPTDSIITRAAIHPAIGIARVGNSVEFDGYFIGPEVPDAPTLAEGEYKDRAGALKRQAACFRIYGYNAAGEVVAELTADNAEIEWTVHLANKKAEWYEFQLALDIPSASDAGVPLSRRRNASITGNERAQLVIDPGPRSIAGRSQHGSSFHFDGGYFFHLPVPLGELRTDASGRLLVFGGHGLSQSRIGTLPTTFANNDDWHDDMSDGPVDATVTIHGIDIPVEGAWIAVAPPNYAPALKTTRTLHDLLLDRMIAWGFIPPPAPVSFQRHIRPIFERLSGLQWVNHGFASWFGAGAPFEADAILPRLADQSPSNREFRERIYVQFRNPGRPSNLGKQLWPQFYGDALDGMDSVSPQNPDPSLAVPGGLASLSQLQLSWLQKWAAGDFESDTPLPIARSLADLDLQRQPEALDEAALAFCLADAFHPGCELTWPMRIRHLYRGSFRIKRRPPSSPEPDFGDVLSPAVAVSPTGPLNGASAGDLTKWMAVPWQTDTASCLAGYTFFNTSPKLLPTFWPARVPNTVLRESDYQTVMDTTLSPQARIEAFHSRVDWFRGLIGNGSSDIAQMITDFGKLGIIEERDGPQDLPGVPSRIWVESPPDLPEPGMTRAVGATTAAAAPAQFGGRKLRQIGRYGAPPE
ncbi:hypothetical protein SAMN05444166_4553 [Singulisphaera sp. GP187]|uniref:LodA/GoxA family CTQ-dependent oxidase n=1 Tax=Singulisphaera sp. GP187 TaxID=1882752 RepID=UPI00092B60BE|nr:LodA/GoxA family CTQ-dependent oxidase [Singulisphaera sp. GP187]SIO41963.1 hypothetical protein SAMN05444166_4553 [Singulisphaera sp. GP187]